MNTLMYEKAVKIDKRTYCEFYQPLLRRKQLLIFIFYTNNYYNSKILKISFFLFSFSLSYAINALFFNDSKMHKIFKNHGKFNYIYLLPRTIYSAIISNTINTIIGYFSFIEKNALELKKQGINHQAASQTIIKCIKIKSVLFLLQYFLSLYSFGTIYHAFVLYIKILIFI